MGCTTSRIDALPAVSLCHDRCMFLEEALHHCCALAEANVAYLVSLKAVGSCLRRFYLEIEHSDLNPSADSESNLKFPAGFPEDEELDRDTDFLHPIHTNHFNDDHKSSSNAEGLTWKTPSPPPAPSSSAWDFLHFFDTYDKYEFPIKEKGDRFLDEPKMAINHQSRANVDVKSEKVIVTGKEHLKERGRGNASAQSTFREFDSLFLKATESGNEVFRILGSGKFRYPDWFSSKMLHKSASTFQVLPPKNEKFFSTAQKTSWSVPGQEFDEELDESSVNLSSTLMKICIWEKKLYSEVKAEEKLCIIYAKKCRQMKILVEKRAKASELDSRRALLSVLFTNINVAIQFIEKISTMINKLRDEELWPLIDELIQKLVGMWKAMLEYHRSHSQAFLEPGLQDTISFSANFSDANLEALIQLNIEVQNWKSSFSNWMNAQRGFVKALNGWLIRFSSLPSKSEQILEVVSPFSPGSTRGIPAVFVICNKWSLAVDRVSETQVIDALHGFSRSINKLLEQNYIYLNQKQNPDKDTEKRMVILEKEFQRMQRLMEVQGRKKLPAAKDVNGGLLLQETDELDQLNKNMNNCLVLDLKQVFMALESFSANIVQSYKEIYLDSDNEKLDQE